ALPPRLMFATALAPRFEVTQLMPLMIQLHCPLPWQLRTRTAWIAAPGATPTTPLASSLAAIDASPSATTYLTFTSARSAATRSFGMTAAYPRSAEPHTASTRAPNLFEWMLATAAGLTAS